MSDQLPKIKFSEKILKIFKELEDNDSYLAFELMYMTEPGSKYFNGLRVTDVDVSKNDYHFNITVNGKVTPMKIGNFIRYYFKNLFTQSDISEFANDYTSLSKGQSPTSASVNKIEKKEFVYDPKDVRSTFLSLVQKTYPHFSDCRHEKEVLKFLPPLTEDEFGNYYKIIGEQPKVMFTSHLDTADREQKVTNLYSKQQGSDEIIYTDGSTILGADDKSGVTVMLYMMAHNIPGLYYFFIGEERGGIGSNALAGSYGKFDYLKDIKKCVSFDRRRTNSVITHQLGRQCCSNEFGTALCKEYNKSGLNLSLDTTGIYTDSASFMDDIAECTNISVGYENEHTGRELQNISFLKRLCEASIKVNWNSLPITRKVGIDQEVFRKNKKAIDDFKSGIYGLPLKIVGDLGKVFVRVDVEDSDIETIYDNLTILQTICNKHKIESDALLVDTFIKIELK
jgi:hypothetical protein